MKRLSIFFIQKVKDLKSVKIIAKIKIKDKKPIKINKVAIVNAKPKKFQNNFSNLHSIFKKVLTKSVFIAGYAMVTLQVNFHQETPNVKQ